MATALTMLHFTVSETCPIHLDIYGSLRDAAVAVLLVAGAVTLHVCRGTQVVVAPHRLAWLFWVVCIRCLRDCQRKMRIPVDFLRDDLIIHTPLRQSRCGGQDNCR